jgi:hypothetical protein
MRHRPIHLVALLVGSVACAAAPEHRPSPHALLDSIAPLAPRCAGVQSCLLGQVVAAESSAPLARAAIFLERDGADARDDAPLRITRLTDDQGVFTIADVPRGQSRLAVYKDARRHEISGVELGAEGTTVVPIRLAPRVEGGREARIE